jgi:hypothetical protein
MTAGDSFAAKPLKLGSLLNFEKYNNYKLAGFVDRLKEEGANEDFVLGFLKEAYMPEENLSEDRHRILPFMNNQSTGAIGGLMLGNLISNELDLDGLPGYILPMLGAYAGYSHLPSLMNSWKDPAGTGANAVHPAVTNFVNARNRAPENPADHPDYNMGDDNLADHPDYNMGDTAQPAPTPVQQPKPAASAAKSTPKVLR